ncbi:MAG: HupE/UreJ family protein, partial [Longimicrobiales bacterium]
PEWAHLGIRTTTVVRFVSPDGTDRVFQFSDNPGLVRLDPQWYHAFGRFMSLGFFHILDGIDHLLFLLCLVIPIRRFWALVPVVTAFTVAHSITLAASVMGLAPNVLWFPPLIETLIAASIVYMALENILKADHRRRWMWAFGFGLVHGFGFSFALSETLQFAGSHLVSSLLAFNLGVEAGQLLVLSLVVPVLAIFFKRVPSNQLAQIVLSALVAHTGWHWMVDRWTSLLAYDLRPPALDALFVLSLLRWVLLFLIVIGTAWALSGLYGRLARRATGPQDTGQQGSPKPESYAR